MSSSRSVRSETVERRSIRTETVEKRSLRTETVEKRSLRTVAAVLQTALRCTSRTVW
eukprot:SAG31_NODE_37177_length_306_cov_1.188406_2_plen_56_part_01